MWRALITEYGQIGTINTAQLQSQHVADQLRPGDDVELWINKFKWRLEKISQTQHFDEGYKCNELLIKLGKATHTKLGDKANARYYSATQDVDRPTFNELCQFIKTLVQTEKLTESLDKLSLKDNGNKTPLFYNREERKEPMVCHSCRGPHRMKDCQNKCVPLPPPQKSCAQYPWHRPYDCPIRREIYGSGRSRSRSRSPRRSPSPGQRHNPRDRRGRSPTPHRVHFAEDTQDITSDTYVDDEYDDGWCGMMREEDDGHHCRGM